jgi:hypothetical protein
MPWHVQPHAGRCRETTERGYVDASSPALGRQKAAKRGHFAVLQEISVCGGLRGGAGSCPTLGNINDLAIRTLRIGPLIAKAYFPPTRTATAKDSLSLDQDSAAILKARKDLPPDFLLRPSKLDGRARAKVLSREQLSEIGRNAVNARWRRYREQQAAGL